MTTKVKIVDYGEQVKVKVVQYGEDMKVTPVEYGEKMKVKIVDYGEDLKVRFVENDSLCFIATACAQAMNLPDDCRELKTVRSFRDDYIRRLPEGDTILSEYYEIAPRIVAAIDASDEPSLVYEDIYAQIQRNVELIAAGCHQEALGGYYAVLDELKRSYLDDGAA